MVTFAIFADSKVESRPNLVVLDVTVVVLVVKVESRPDLVVLDVEVVVLVVGGSSFVVGDDNADADD